MFIKRVLLILISVIASTSTALACESKEINCGPFTSWYDANWLEMTIRDGQGRGNTHWVISLDKTRHDSIIELDEHYDGKGSTGTIMIISGRMMLTKGVELREGHEIDAADGPGLMMQLLLNLMSHIAPDGPQSLNGKSIVNHIERNKSIKVGTASASGVFSTPWTANGTLEKQEDNIVEYDIKFESTVGGGNKYAAEMKGKWEVRKLDVLEDSMALDGWKIYRIGPYMKKYNNETIFDYGAQIAESEATTIGQLRQEIEAAKSAPNKAPQPTK